MTRSALEGRNGRAVSAAGFVLLIVGICVCAAEADKLCYACNSYMAQCQHPTLAAGTSNVFQARCSSKCFTRQGEDDAIYRGCFDAFKAVKQLTDNYVGCRNQTWNNRVRRWCLCDSDLCNTHAIGDDLRAAAASTSKHQRSHLTTSSSSSSITPTSSQHHQTHHVVVDRHTYPPSLAVVPQASMYVTKSRGDARHPPYRSSPNDENATTTAAARQQQQQHHVDPAEYRTVWNNWHVDVAGSSSSSSDDADKMTSLPTNVDPRQQSVGGGGWIEAPRGVLHSVHRDQQATSNYGDHQQQLQLYRDETAGGPVGRQGGDRSTDERAAAKSASRDSDSHESIEPISADHNVSVVDVGPSTTTGGGRAAPSHRAEFDRAMRENPQPVERRPVEKSSTTSSEEFFDDAADEGRRQRKRSSYDEPPTALFDGDGPYGENNETADELEVLEYPYNQEFTSHPIEWLPMDYAVDDYNVAKQGPAMDNGVGVESTDDSSSSVALGGGGGDGDDAATPAAASIETVDYPYNQYRERSDSNVDDGDNSADYSSPVVATSSSSAAALKEAPSEETGDHRAADEELVEKSLDYPYNQMVVVGSPASSSTYEDRHQDTSSASNSTSGQLLLPPPSSAGAVKHTIHADDSSKTMLSKPSMRRGVPSAAPADDDTSRTPSGLRRPVSPTAAYSPDQIVVHHQQHLRHPPVEQQQQSDDSMPSEGVVPSVSSRRVSGDGADVRDVLHAKHHLHRAPPSVPASSAADDFQRRSAAAGPAVGPQIAPLKTKDGQYERHPGRGVDGQGRHGDRQSSDPAKWRGLVQAKEGDDGFDYEKMDEAFSQFHKQMVPQIRCAQTGYYQNPKDCTQFVACLFDHNTHTKVLHLMRCPSGLVWDNHHKLCIETSSTCREGLTQADLDSNYVQFFADVNAAAAASSSSPGVDDGQQPLLPPQVDNGLLNDIKNKNVGFDDQQQQQQQH